MSNGTPFETVNWGKRTGQQVLEDVESSSAHAKNIMWKKNTDLLRHVVCEKRGRGAITFTYFCEHRKVFPVEDFLWWG